MIGIEYTPMAALEAINLLSLRSETLGSALLAFSIEIPFLIATGLLLMDDRSKRSIRILAVSGFAIPALISVFLAFNYHSFARDGYAFYGDLSTGLQRFGISFKFGLNGISMPLYLLAGIVGLAAGLYAVRSEVDRLRQYLCLLLAMQGGLMGVFVSVDIFFFYFFHQVALIPTFIMIAVWGYRERRSAAMEMAIYLTLGAMLSLLGLVAIYVESGIKSFDLMSLKSHLRTTGLPTVVQEYSFALLLFGFGILVSLWPFHSWAPRGYGAAPTSTAMLHAGVLKKFGLYGLIQIGVPLLPEGALSWGTVLVWLALGNVVVIGFVTLSQRDLRQMTGFSSVMHMGYAFLGIACLSAIGVGGAVLLMFAHGLSVALLFLLSTCTYHRTGTFDMEEMGGLAVRVPVLAGFFVAATLASVGLPGFANFWGALAIFVGLWDYRPWLLVPAAAGIVISAVYGLRAVARVFFGEPAERFRSTGEGEKIVDLMPWERLPAALLLGVLVLVGFWPRMMTDPINDEVQRNYPATRENSPDLSDASQTEDRRVSELRRDEDAGQSVSRR